VQRKKERKREGFVNRTDLTRKNQGSEFKKRNGRGKWRVEALGGLNDFPWARGLGRATRTRKED
jgi:hypothetical protein